MAKYKGEWPDKITKWFLAISMALISVVLIIAMALLIIYRVFYYPHIG